MPMETSTMVTGKTTKLTASDSTLTQMALNTKATGSMISNMVLEKNTGLMELSMKAIISSAKKMMCSFLSKQTHAGGLAKLGSLSPLWLVLLVPRLPVRSLDFTESHAHNLVQSKMQNVFHATTHFRKTPHGE